MSLCNNIRCFSTDVFHFLTEVFSHKLTFSEIGLTDHLILNLVRYCKMTGDNTITIYKTSWKYESKYGNDIDLFVENNSGKFNWYALQAKVMSYNGAFRDLKFDKTKPHQQWEKLLLHERSFGSKTYYLLYSGKSKIKFPITNPKRLDCIGIPLIEELGLGIVDTQVIYDIRKTKIRSSQMFYFKYIFPDYIDSFRKLFCCSELPKTTKQFYHDEINLSGYEKIYSHENNTNESGTDKLEKDGCAPIRVIIKKK